MSRISIRDQVMQSLPATVKEIATRIHVTEPAVGKNLRDLAREGKTHIEKEFAGGARGRGPVWAAGPAPAGAPKQPDWDRRRAPRPALAIVKNTSVVEDATIERARAAPATWLSGLG